MLFNFELKESSIFSCHLNQALNIEGISLRIELKLELFDGR